MTGAGQRSIASSMPRRAFASATFASKSRSTEARIHSTSAPAQKLGPSPASSTARALPTSTNASESSAISAASKALRISGRARVTLSRSPSRSIRSAPICRRSLQNPRIPLRLSAVGLTPASYRPLVTSSRGSTDVLQGSSGCDRRSWRPPSPVRPRRPRVHFRAGTGASSSSAARRTTAGSSSLYLINQNGTGLVRLTRGYQHDAQPSWSPNGQLIAFESTRRGDTDVYVVRPDGSSLKELTFSQGFDGDPAWNDDGSRIAFETTRNGPFDIYAINSDGTGAGAADDGPEPRRGSGLVSGRDEDRLHERAVREAAGVGDERRRNRPDPADERRRTSAARTRAGRRTGARSSSTRIATTPATSTSGR